MIRDRRKRLAAQRHEEHQTDAQAGPKIGDEVWFISKFGDRVTGIYESDSEMPKLLGDKIPMKGHSVRSHNAFGEYDPHPTLCWVPLGRLRKVAK